jgi:alpha/beta hydrolase fold
MPNHTRRVAELRLRSSAGPLRVRVEWPVATGGTPTLLVFLPDAGEATAALFSRAGAVVLSARPEAFYDAVAALEWAADHAAELGADPRRLVVAGGALAAALALHARDRAWPALTRQVLIGADLDRPLQAATVAGVAPATVVVAGHDSGRRYAARLRQAGVEVEELRDEEELSRSLERTLP